MSREARRAAALMFKLLPIDLHALHRDPVAAADLRTSMNDARTGLCIALGVPLHLIHPASGHDLSDGWRPSQPAKQLELFGGAA